MHLEEIIQIQIEFSEKTFGPGPRDTGLIDHIKKELAEIKNDPGDIEEWIDVIILALDGAWRNGYSPEEIVHMLTYKQAKNRRREWPDWRTAEPGKAIEHIKQNNPSSENCYDCPKEHKPCDARQVDCPNAVMPKIATDVPETDFGDIDKTVSAKTPKLTKRSWIKLPTLSPLTTRPYIIGEIRSVLEDDGCVEGED